MAGNYSAFGSNAYGVSVKQGAFKTDKGPKSKTYH
jgi:hypothetical protein